MIWEKIEGQPSAVEYLRRSLARGRTAHAYLFVGPEGVGKSLCARLFAQALSCRRQDGDGCGSCPSCRAFAQSAHPDFRSFSPRGVRGGIVIDQIREIDRLAWLAPQMDGWKAIVIDRAETMNDEAANAFLKTLEEPPPRTVFLLLTSRPDGIVATVRSRCQTVRFHPWAFSLMEPFLRERAGIGREEAWALHCATGGLPGAALRTAEEKFTATRALVLRALAAGRFGSARELMAEASAWLDDLEEKHRRRAAALEKQRPPGLDPQGIKDEEEKEEAYLAAEKRADFDRLLLIVLSWFRDLELLGAGGQRELVVNQDQLAALESRAGGLRPGAAAAALARVETSRRAVRLGGAGRFTYQLTLENLFLQLGFWGPG